ncbi:MAG TPA: HipA family kinase [Thermoleophilaceae bacterium]|jgi:hypothetical protein
MLRRVNATVYVTPLREGGSLPAIVEADDDGMYVVKFRGAGQGVKALVAEIVAGELGRALELEVPELVLVELDPAIGAAEPDPEIQDLLNASAGENVGLDFLPGALAFTEQSLDRELAANIVWFDALVTNVDRTPRNPNLLEWHGRVWLIDHGAALFQHHVGDELVPDAPFPMIRDHVLLPQAGSIVDAHERLAPLLDRAVLDRVVELVPDGWRGPDYADYLERRLRGAFAQEAEDARS